jgi:hypothetical protein
MHKPAGSMFMPDPNYPFALDTQGDFTLLFIRNNMNCFALILQQARLSNGQSCFQKEKEMLRRNITASGFRGAIA